MKDSFGIDKFYIIISKKYEENRYTYLQEYFANHPEFDVEYVDALWCDDVNSVDLSHYNRQILKIPEIMLIETNIRLFNKILTNTDYSHVYICESDIIFQPNFPEKFREAIEEWKSLKKDKSVVFTGNGCNLKPHPSNRVSNTLYKQNGSRCTDSILYTRSAIEAMYNELMTTWPISKSLDHIPFYGDDKVISYYLEPHIVSQGSQNNTYKSSIAFR